MLNPKDYKQAWKDMKPTKVVDSNPVPEVQPLADRRTCWYCGSPQPWTALICSQCSRTLSLTAEWGKVREEEWRVTQEQCVAEIVEKKAKRFEWRNPQNKLGYDMNRGKKDYKKVENKAWDH